MSSHERAATKQCTQCSRLLDLKEFSGKSAWCKGCINAYSKQHYQRRRQHVLNLKRAYRAANPEKAARDNITWRAANLEKAKTYLKEYRRANRGKINSLEARRHSDKIQRTPKWANLALIEQVYRLAKRISAETGVRQSVDHIYPMRGKTVSGLHVAENLRVIPLRENCKKRNRVPVEDIV